VSRLVLSALTHRHAPELLSHTCSFSSRQSVNEINEALGQNFATPDDIDEADLDAELDMLGDELEEIESEEAVPSYLMPAQPSITPGMKEEDEYGLPSAPIGQRM
jgi:hypothetical protein